MVLQGREDRVEVASAAEVITVDHGHLVGAPRATGVTIVVTEVLRPLNHHRQEMRESERSPPW